jgi:hypothetical protein
MSLYGNKNKVPDHFHLRSVINADVEISLAGNVILEIGRENENNESWIKTEHVVLTWKEAEELGQLLMTTALEAERIKRGWNSLENEDKS